MATPGVAAFQYFDRLVHVGTDHCIKLLQLSWQPRAVQTLQDWCLEVRNNQLLSALMQIFCKSLQHLNPSKIHVVYGLRINDNEPHFIARLCPDPQYPHDEFFELPRIDKVEACVHSHDHRVWDLFSLRKAPDVSKGGFVVDLSEYRHVWVCQLMHCLEDGCNEPNCQPFLNSQSQRHNKCSEHHDELSATGHVCNLEVMQVDNTYGSLDDNRCP
mmetsp:Transcript_52813/g.97748  ORF Transcript_52813/g.97748 Transcript_52813/m.97748 type:complete len:215 (-) Transcript_52813:11-655(-)